MITTIDKTGPFFRSDPVRTFRQNIRTMMDAVAREGESDVRAQLAPHSRTGATVAGVIGRTASLGGKRWAVSAVVSQTHVYPWPGGGQKQYRGGKLEAKTHAFRKTASRIRSTRAVNVAELLKGIA